MKQAELIERLNWYINTRWITAFSIVIASAFAYLLNIEIPVAKVLFIVFVILGYNLIFSNYLKKNVPSKPEMFVLLQSAADLITLLLLIHYLGGVENPFIFYFIFHTILTSLMLPKKLTYVQALSIITAVGGLIILEFSSIIPHYHLEGFLKEELYKNAEYVIGVYFAFSTSIFFTAYIASSISEKLKTEEKKLEELNAVLLENDRKKSDYVKMVAHDIKSPLSTVLSILSVISEGYTEELNHKASALLEKAKAKTEFLHNYVSDLLNLSVMRSQRSLDLKSVDIKSLIEEAVILTSDKEKKKKIALTVNVNGMPQIIANRAQILHVIVNLISNAFQYTPDGGSVSIKGAYDDDSVAIIVSDTGIGIPKEEVQNIFEEFYRASNAEKITKGTGFGLTMVKYIVERHFGTITVKSELNKGACFTVRLPLKPPGA